MLGQSKLQALIGTTRADAARAFYGDLLGLTLVTEDMFALVYAIGDGVLRVSKVPAVSPSPYAVLGFMVPDIAAVVRGLTGAGVELAKFPFLPQDQSGVWTAPDGAKVIWFRDPDMNLVSATQSP